LLKQAHVEVVVIESDDEASAVAEEVTKYAITKLVVAASTGGLFKRYFYNDNKIILVYLDSFWLLIKIYYHQ